MKGLEDGNRKEGFILQLKKRKDKGPFGETVLCL